MELSTVKRMLKLILLPAAALLLISLLAYTFRAQLLTDVARLLIVNDPLRPADIIFVLNGDVNTRPFLAAELFKRGLAGQIVIPQEENSPAAELGLYPNGTDVSIQVMQKLGVPTEKITVIAVEGGVTSTRDEALVLRHYIDRYNLQHIIVVTSAFHTRRARWIIEKTLSGSDATLMVAAAPHWKYDETNWWRQELGLIALANEYIKLLYYFVSY
jgi:uncharacterized SAM-binding protein YcdF (DUF218 family)